MKDPRNQKAKGIEDNKESDALKGGSKQVELAKGCTEHPSVRLSNIDMVGKVVSCA